MIPKKLIPTANTIVCIKINKNPENHLVSTGNFFYVEKESDVPEYKIIDWHFFTEEDKRNFPFEIGDIIYSASTGSEATIDNVKYYMFKPEHIVGKKL